MTKVAVVTGASRGVGLAIARRFLDEGARATITGRGAEDLERARRSLVSASDQGRVLAVQADMTDRSDIDRALDETARVHGGIDAVVATVGVSSGNAGWDLDEDDWSLFLSSNLLGGTALATMARPRLRFS